MNIRPSRFVDHREQISPLWENAVWQVLKPQDLRVPPAYVRTANDHKCCSGINWVNIQRENLNSIEIALSQQRDYHWMFQNKKNSGRWVATYDSILISDYKLIWMLFKWFMMAVLDGDNFVCAINITDREQQLENISKDYCRWLSVLSVEEVRDEVTLLSNVSKYW
jgi:hypothetical protein